MAKGERRVKVFLETADVAEQLGVGVRHVQRMARDGRIPFVRNGRHIRIPAAAWEQFVADQAATALANVKQGGANGNPD